MALGSLKSVVGAGIGKAAHLALPGFAIYSTTTSWNDRVRRGQNPFSAAALEGANFAFSVMAPWAHFGLTIGAPIVRAATEGVISSVKSSNDFKRSVRTPFSHRFEHTDTTARAQSLGLQALGSAWGSSRMGSEASAFAQRYGRR